MGLASDRRLQPAFSWLRHGTMMGSWRPTGLGRAGPGRRVQGSGWSASGGELWISLDLSTLRAAHLMPAPTWPPRRPYATQPPRGAHSNEVRNSFWAARVHAYEDQRPPLKK